MNDGGSPDPAWEKIKRNPKEAWKGGTPGFRRQVLWADIDALMRQLEPGKRILLVPGTAMLTDSGHVGERLTKGDTYRAFQQLASRSGYADRVTRELRGRGRTEFPITIPGIGRYLTVAMVQRGSVAIMVRRIGEAPTARLSQEVMAGLTRPGIVAVSGGTDAERTAAIAGLVNSLVREVPVMACLIEQPVEYLIPHGKGIVIQMDVGTDCRDIDGGIQAAIRYGGTLIGIHPVPRSAIPHIRNAVQAGACVVVPDELPERDWRALKASLGDLRPMLRVSAGDLGFSDGGGQS